MELFLFCLRLAIEERPTGSSWAVGDPALNAVNVASMAPCDGRKEGEREGGIHDKIVDHFQDR